MPIPPGERVKLRLGLAADIREQDSRPDRLLLTGAGTPFGWAINTDK